jgi:hypothetical protein
MAKDHEERAQFYDVQLKTSSQFVECDRRKAIVSFVAGRDVVLQSWSQIRLQTFG